MFWDQIEDSFKFKVKLNFSPKHRKVRTGPDVKRTDLEQIRSLLLTKRSVLSQISGMFDPLGLLVPFTATAKIMMQQLWKNELKTLDWDDPLPKDISEKWLEFFDEWDKWLFLSHSSSWSEISSSIVSFTLVLYLLWTADESSIGSIRSINFERSRLR